MNLSPQTENLVSRVEAIYKLHKPGKSLPDQFSAVLDYSYRERPRGLRSHKIDEIFLLFDSVDNAVRDYESARTYYEEEFCLTPEEALKKVRNKRWLDDAGEIVSAYTDSLQILGTLLSLPHAMVRTGYTLFTPYSLQAKEFSRNPNHFPKTLFGKLNFSHLRWAVSDVATYCDDPGFKNWSSK